ncbi:hypothetical protein QF015_004094 [Paenarthrobacter sp. TE4293]|uniref:hypothetical protein n=1 Tax=Paenarthrobacter sp. TE4293 TaxID=3381695 RepID=UPI003D1E633B
MSGWESKLETLDAAREGMSADERRAFNSRLIGALAASHISTRVWAEAIENAKDSGALSAGCVLLMDPNSEVYSAERAE